MIEWRFAPAVIVRSWSLGQVSSVSDLRSQAIFGPLDDLRCECGKYEGREYDKMICDRCGVPIDSNAAWLRKTRLGHVDLAHYCRHPLGAEGGVIDAFPVAPVHYRVAAGGETNELGRKYEELLRVNEAIATELPDRRSEAYYEAIRTFDRSRLEDAIARVVGQREALDTTVSRAAEHHSLLSELLSAIVRLDPAVASLVRAIGCTIRVEGML
jgi:hypothetical protein